MGAYEYASSDTIAPIITSFSIPSEASSLTISITAFEAQDDTSVTGYLVNESASVPNSDDSSWSATAQTSYTFSSAGTKTLYAWTKDANNNISNAISRSITVTLSQQSSNSSSGNSSVTTYSSGGGYSYYSFTKPIVATTSTSTIMKNSISSNRFIYDMYVGMIHKDVKALQILLNKDLDTVVSRSGPGSPGNETNYFGNKTFDAVKRFQNKYYSDILKPANIKKPTGYIGKFTINILNKLYTK
jgi:hypothetical protein